MSNGSNGEIQNCSSLNGPAMGFGKCMNRPHRLCILVLKNRRERKQKCSTSMSCVKIFWQTFYDYDSTARKKYKTKCEITVVSV